MTFSKNRLSRRNALKLTGAGALASASLGHSSKAYASSQTTASGPLAGEIDVWYHPFATGIEEVYEGFRQDFEAENPDAKVNLELIPFADRYPKILTAIAAGEAPDVISITIDALIRFVEAGALVSLEDLLPSESWEGYDEKFINDVTYQGEKWCLPIEQEVSVWPYNKSIFEQVGLAPEQPPFTWSEIVEMCETVKSSSDGSLWGWGYDAASPTLNTTFYPFLYQAGGRPFSEDGSEPTFNSDAGVSALEFIVELFDRGFVSPEYMSPINEASESPFFQQRQALGARGNQGTIIDLREGVPDLDFSLTPTLKHTEQWGFGGFRSWAITSNSKNRESAAAFLDFLARPENMLIASEAIGRFPTKQAAAEQAYADDPLLASLRSAIPFQFGEQRHKYGRDIMPLVIPEIQAAILQEKTAKEALDEAAESVRELLEQG